MLLLADAWSDISWAALVLSVATMIVQLIRERWQIDRDKKVSGLELELEKSKGKAAEAANEAILLKASVVELEATTRQCERERAADKAAAAAELAELQAKYDKLDIVCDQQQVQIDKLEKKVEPNGGAT